MRLYECVINDENGNFDMAVVKWAQAAPEGFDRVTDITERASEYLSLESMKRLRRFAKNEQETECWTALIAGF